MAHKTTGLMRAAARGGVGTYRRLTGRATSIRLGVGFSRSGPGIGDRLLLRRGRRLPWAFGGRLLLHHSVLAGLQCGQGVDDRLCGAGPVGGVLGQQMQNQVGEFRRDFRVEVAWRVGVLCGHGQQRRHRSLALERQFAGGQAIEHAAEAEEIAAMIDGIVLACSGAMYAGVPTTAPLWVRWTSSSTARARPKSES